MHDGVPSRRINYPDIPSFPTSETILSLQSSPRRCYVSGNTYDTYPRLVLLWCSLVQSRRTTNSERILSLHYLPATDRYVVPNKYPHRRSRRYRPQDVHLFILCTSKVRTLPGATLRPTRHNSTSISSPASRTRPAVAARPAGQLLPHTIRIPDAGASGARS